jgi:hypothetical protein
MVDIPEKDLALLEEINKEKFKRKLSLFRSISSRTLALLLILAIVWFGWVNYSYANDVRQYRADYGEQWSCYLCGVENLKSCSCVYQPELVVGSPDFNLTSYKEALGFQNSQQCVSRKNPRDNVNLSNFSIINISSN